MNSPETKNGLDKAAIVLRLYSIRNIAILAAYCPEQRIEVDHLQDVASHLADMVQSLIEEIDC